MRNLKKVLSLVLCVAMMLSVMVMSTGATSFSDEDEFSPQYKEAAEVLTGMGVMQGYEDGSYFLPQRNITRAQVATLIYRAVTGDVNDTQTDLYKDWNKFKDVPSTDWSAGYVNYCANGEIIKGFTPDTFGPLKNVTGYQVLAMILRAVGYDKNDEFTGTGWELRTATTAKEVGLLKNVQDTTLGQPATRELVAELIFRAMNAPMVKYNLIRDDYVPVLDKNDNTISLGQREFNLASKTAFDEYYRPNTTWYNTKTDADYAVINYEPLAEYTTAVDQCTVAEDLGLTKPASYQVANNGVATGQDKDLPANGTGVGVDLGSADKAATKAEATGTGVLTQVYESPYYNKKGNPFSTVKYIVVEIDTYLAEVVGTEEATFDANGHTKTPATIYLEVYDQGNNTSSLIYLTNGETNYTYDEGDMILVSGVSKDKDKASNTLYDQLKLTTSTEKYGTKTYTEAFDAEIVGDAGVSTGTLTGYHNGNKTSTISGTTYDWAAQYNMGNPGVNKTTYNVYTDAYGNLIGLAQPSTTYGYGTITDIAWQDSDHLASDYVEANIMGVDGQAINNITIDNPWTSSGNDAGHFDGQDANVNTGTKVSEDLNKNTDFYGHLFKYSVDADGNYTIEEVGTCADDATLDPAKSYIEYGTTKPVVNNNTVYLVKSDDDTYTTYTGYKNVPAMSGVSVCWFANDSGSYVTYVFVDATDATYAGSTELATFFDGDKDAMLGDLNGYEMWINGEEVTRYVADGEELSDLATIIATGTYLVEYDANGNIIKLTKLTWTDDSALDLNTTQMDAYYCDGTVIRNATTGVSSTESYDFTGANVYVIHSASQTVTVGSADDVADSETGVHNYLLLNEAGTAVVTSYIVVND